MHVCSLLLFDCYCICPGSYWYFILHTSYDQVLASYSNCIHVLNTHICKYIFKSFTWFTVCYSCDFLLVLILEIVQFTKQCLISGIIAIMYLLQIYTWLKCAFLLQDTGVLIIYNRFSISCQLATITFWMEILHSYNI